MNSVQLSISDQIPLEWESQLIAYLKTAYRSDIALANAEILKWQYQDQTCGKFNIMMGHVNGQIVGILGYVQQSFFWGSFPAIKKGCWALNWHVMEDWRNGLGWSMMRRLQSKFNLVTSLDFSPQNYAITSLLEWKSKPSVPRWLYVFDHSAIVEVKNARNNCPTQFTSKESNFNVKKINYDVNSCMDWDCFFSEYAPDWKHYPSMHFGVIRDVNFLSWRYQRHPHFKYFVMRHGTENRPSVCVFRIENAFGLLQGAVARLVEFFHPNDSEGLADALHLMADLKKLLLINKVMFVECYMSSDAIGNALRKAGWLLDDDKNPLLPTKLTPVKFGGECMNIQYYDGLCQPSFGELYMTRGDVDADRLTSSNLAK